MRFRAVILTLSVICGYAAIPETASAQCTDADWLVRLSNTAGKTTTTTVGDVRQYLKRTVEFAALLQGSDEGAMLQAITSRVDCAQVRELADARLMELVLGDVAENALANNIRE